MAEPSSPTGIELQCQVIVADEQTDIDVDADRWAALATAVLEGEQCAGELTLTFVDRAEITSLNRDHMGQDGPTDVLSFPLDAGAGSVAAGPVLLGDVVICPAVAAEAAPEHAGTLDDELALLTVHGVLHVLGHDHADPDQTSRMRAREHDLLTAHHWFGPAPAAFRQEHPAS